MNNSEFIIFDEKKFDALICLDANLPEDEHFRSVADLPLLAADGAGVKLLKRGINPDFVIGDLDSFFKDPLSSAFDSNKLIKITEQETNDFEKALKFAASSNYKNILIFGIHGGELEHTLNNWSVLKRNSDEFNFVVFDQKRYGLIIKNNVTIKCRLNELISLIPQISCVLSTSGLKWELNNFKLEIGYNDGARNVALREEIKILVHSGEVLLFMDERLPYSPFFTT